MLNILCISRHGGARRIGEYGLPHLAKVGVEGSNPFARSKISQRFQADKNGPSGPFLLTLAFPAVFVSSRERKRAYIQGEFAGKLAERSSSRCVSRAFSRALICPSVRARRAPARADQHTLTWAWMLAG